MDKLTNPAARRYLRQVRRLLPCAGKLKDEITAPLVQSVSDFLEEAPQADAEALRTRFGAPEVIAASCLENTDTGAVLKQLQWKRRVLAIVAAAAALLLISWGVFLTICHIQLRHTVLEGYNVIEGPVVEEVIELPDVTLSPNQ